ESRRLPSPGENSLAVRGGAPRSAQPLEEVDVDLSAGLVLLRPLRSQRGLLVYLHPSLEIPHRCALRCHDLHLLSRSHRFHALLCSDNGNRTLRTSDIESSHV